jgi:N-acetylglucosaminyldiphosphoundecaprenol N-acetyl-beta-D-mannosaminyltransferase
MRAALDIADHCVARREPGYICFTGVHGVTEALRDPELRRVVNRALVNAPDGMPMTWVGRLQGYRQMDRVFGPDFMLEFCRLSVSRGYRHYFYGGERGVAELLRVALTEKVHGLQVVGVCTPPFTELTAEEENELIRDIQRTRPDIVWLGISTPRQERFMATYLDRLRVPLIAGVGAAFDYHTGRIRDCAPWIKRSGLQWAHRLCQDPRRLSKRYLRSHSTFVWHIVMQILELKHYSDTDAAKNADLLPHVELSERS